VRARRYFEPTPNIGGKTKTLGQLHVMVNEGRRLAGSDPYVKLYISNKNVNIKKTKRKTKSQKRQTNPMFSEKFVIDILKT
jgi:Ca2+-dependent lipid-binding protein